MRTVDALREGLHRTGQQLAEGWHQLRERATRALTRFHPPTRRGELETADEQFMQRASRWGLLAAEVEEQADAVIVRLEAAGMEPDDFDIQVIDDMLHVQGEKQVQRTQAQGRYHLMECAYGRFERYIELPVPVDEARARAQYRRGVLRVTLPKRTPDVSRRINVEAH